MADRKLVIKGGTVVDPTGRRDGIDVAVEDGRIVAAGPDLDPGDATVLDAGGCLVAPGGDGTRDGPFYPLPFLVYDPARNRAFVLRRGEKCQREHCKNCPNDSHLMLAQ